MARVAIIMGSDSDLPIMKEVTDALKLCSIDYKITVISAHRTPKKLIEFAEKESKDYDVIIAGAGGAAHLPGVLAAFINKPIIGVPIKTPTLNGLDSLYSIVQMPKGMPVATVAINGAFNAGLLAAQIIALSDENVKKKVDKFRENQKEKVYEKAKKVENEN